MLVGMDVMNETDGERSSLFNSKINSIIIQYSVFQGFKDRTIVYKLSSPQCHKSEILPYCGKIRFSRQCSITFVTIFGT